LMGDRMATLRLGADSSWDVLFFMI
jgi:hypothetical protein